MARLLALDYGAGRIGIAVSDPTKTIVRAYSAIKTSNKSVEEIKKICDDEKVEKIVLGLPIGLSGNETNQTRETRKFKLLLEKGVSLPIEFEDERLTSRMADFNLRESGRKEKNDAEAAAVILRGYLDRVSS